MNLPEKQKARRQPNRRVASKLAAAIALFAVFAMAAGAVSAQDNSIPINWEGAAFYLAHDASIVDPDPRYASCYEPLPEYSDNSSWSENGGSPTVVDVDLICRLSTGKYEVSAAGFDLAGVAHVNALELFAPEGRTCKVERIDSDFGLEANTLVGCYDSSGSPADAQFSFSFTNRKPATGTFGYFTTNGNGPWGCQAVPASGQHHASGGSASVCSFMPGVYTVNLPAQASTIGNVQVTAVGTDSTRCKAQGWWASSITVQCHKGATLTASDFGLTYVGGAGSILGGEDCCIRGRVTAGYAYVWDAVLPAYEMAAPAWNQHNGGPGFGVGVTNGSTGQHNTRFFSAPGADTSDIAMVTAVGAGPDYCNLNSWSDDRVTVNCFDASGKLKSSPHNVAMNSAWRWS